MIGKEVQQYLVKVCKALNAHGVDYLVVGGAAVSHYGYNRPSGIGESRVDLRVDLDFWYNPVIENYQKLVNALNDLDVDVEGLKTLVFDKRRTFLKVPHKDFHTDFLPIIEGLRSFRICKGKAERIDIGGVTLAVLSIEDLIANKLAVNRQMDRTDIEHLKRIKDAGRRKKRRGP